MGPTSPLDKHAGEAGGGCTAGHLVDQQMLGGWDVVHLCELYKACQGVW